MYRGLRIFTHLEQYDIDNMSYTYILCIYYTFQISNIKFVQISVPSPYWNICDYHHFKCLIFYMLLCVDNLRFIIIMIIIFMLLIVIVTVTMFILFPLTEGVVRFVIVFFVIVLFVVLLFIMVIVVIFVVVVVIFVIVRVTVSIVLVIVLTVRCIIMIIIIMHALYAWYVVFIVRFVSVVFVIILIQWSRSRETYQKSKSNNK